MEERIDKILVQRNLVESRVKAENIIHEIGVKVYGKLVTKPGKKFPVDCKIELIAEDFPWKSIESLKLVAAFSKWKLSCKGGYFFDIGIFNGAFTEVLLKDEAKKIYALDSQKEYGSSQLYDNEVLVDFSGKFLRELTAHSVTDEIDGCVIDETILSMDKVLPFIHPFLKKGAFVISVIKPQLEVGKDHLKNNGSVRNTLGFEEMFETLKKVGETNNLTLIEHIPSPIIGKDGQQEFLVYFKKI